jgi:Spy/CpxP family protein refolding chaperone
MPGGPGGMNGGSPNGMPPPGGPPPNSGQSGRGPEAARPGLQLGPPGQRWWDDKSFVKSLKLRPEQQAHMDAIFEQNKGALVSRLQSLHQAESQMAEIAKSSSPDESALFTQIDRVAQARAELEKANTHMLLQLRKEMDPDQIDRLERHH